MVEHDPRDFIENLRNHLAARDRRLLFLFGAGTSCSVNLASSTEPGTRLVHNPLIPDVAGLTASCFEVVQKDNRKHGEAWALLVQQCAQDGVPSNIESILSKVRTKLDAIGEDDRLVGLGKGELEALERTICRHIATSVGPNDESIPSLTPHDSFAAWAKRASRTVPLEVFTTNYDLLFERAFEAARTPHFDGFVGSNKPFFFPECLEDENQLPRPSWVRFWKLHGSINWAVEEFGNSRRIVRSQSSDSGEMILPSHRKYDESRKQPYIAYMDRLARLLNQEHTLAITCGYSFQDAHLNAILYGALDNSRTTNVVALQFDDIGPDTPLVRAATVRSNLSIVGRNAAVLGSEFGAWRLGQRVDSKTWRFMDVAFDSDAVVPNSPSPVEGLSGQMRLGDFNRFCRFLTVMGPGI